MKFFAALGFSVLATAVAADDVAVERASHASFADMPVVERVDTLAGVCGSDGFTNPDVVYCTSQNTVYLRRGAPDPGYKLAHVMGHAVQVRHGIADIALRQITQRRDEETALRGLVTRQVECIAGFLMARAGVPEMDFSNFAREPFTSSHWGRNPLRIGPKVSIGLEARAQWYASGYHGDTLAVCAVGEFGAELLLKAYKG